MSVPIVVRIGAMMHRQPGLGFGLVRGQVRAKVRWIERGQGEGGDRVRIRVWGWLELDFRLGFGLELGFGLG